MFVTPLFLIASAVGAAIPLMLHLMQKKNSARSPFPTLRFLEQAVQQSSRRVKMEHLLLWLLRTLIMLFLGLAFAMPMLRTHNFAWLGNTPRDVGIIIDASYSMDYNLGRETVWDKALGVAKTVIEGLGENDRFCIYVASEQPVPVIAEPTSDREDGLARLKGLKRGHASSSLAPTLMAVNDVLKSETRRREREIYVLTDGQALPWTGFRTSDGEPEQDGTAQQGAWDPSSVGEKTILFVALLGATAPENVAPADIVLNPPILLKGTDPNITARLIGTGNAMETVVSMHRDGEEISRRTARVGVGADSNPSFSIPSLPVGTHAVSIQTPDDNLPIDNEFHFLVRVRDELPTLCVGTKEDTFFARAALSATAGGAPGSESKSRWVTADALASESLHAYASVFLCNALPMSGQASTALEQHVRSGGLVALFPGPAAAPSDYQAWQCLPGVPTGMEDVRQSRRKRMLTWEQPRHPMLHALQDSLAPPVVTMRRHLAWDTLAPETETLVTLGDGTPFLLDRPYGQGHVLMFAVPADRSWSDFPLSPFYLPMIRQTIEYGAGIGAFAPYLWSCATLPLSANLPEATSASRITDPDGQAVPIRSAIIEGRTVLHAENLALPGVYSLTQPGQTPAPGFAINLDRRESDLTPLPPADLPELLRIKKLQIATDSESLLKLIKELRVGRTFGEHLLWLVLILALGEFIYANLLLKDRPKLGDMLQIKASGKVGGHTPHVGGNSTKGGTT
ncbi:MAG: VWA domain-containing protein [Verrucomicrobia bacterium]|jgi:hypothetical protein|nr:VWA domain-containing protein [Verrucomicrobiota bacterium]